LFKRPESVLVVVHTDDGQVLQLLRREPTGFWQSVTGSLQEGETPLKAARR
jgi:dATP pyrophosphohydrolase